MEHTEEFEFEDAETYRGSNDKLSFRILVLNQLVKIAANANVEFRGGYFDERSVTQPDGSAKIIHVYVPDTREVYSNSVEFLHDLLVPHFRLDKKMRPASEKYAEQLQKLLEHYMADGKFTEEEKVSYREQRRDLCRQLFIALSCFLERINYFGERSV
jgi:hypothetical protein